MTLFKSATLLVCMTLSACSLLSKEDAKVDKPAPPAQAKVEQPTVDKAWLDGYEPRLREALKGSPFEVARRDDGLVVTAPVDRAFNPDRPGMLLPVMLGPITKVAKLVETDSKAAVLVLGHGDDSGEAAARQTLSRERAGAVAAIFRLSGLKQDRLSIRGVGSTMPRAANDSKENRALNRRVEMVLVPQVMLPVWLARYETPVVAPTQVVALAEPAKGAGEPAKAVAEPVKKLAEPAKKAAEPAKGATESTKK